jgi:hypothetical protein
MKVLPLLAFAFFVLLCLSAATPVEARTWHILPDGTGDAPTIQAGIDSAVHYDTVLLAPGTYNECIGFMGKKITVGSYFVTTQDTTYISQTVIDGFNLFCTVVTFTDGENYSAKLCGLTIIRGHGSWLGYMYGGGILCNNTNPVLCHLVIRDNFFLGAEQFGGGIACLNGSCPLVEHSIIEANQATFGGGIYCQGPGSDPLIRESIIRGNASHYGGGVSAYIGANPILEKVIVAGNMSTYGMGGVFGESGDTLTLVNVTFSGNQGRAVHLANGSHATIVNTILWGDEATEIEFSSGQDPCSVVLSHCDVLGGLEGIQTNGNGTVHWLDGNLDEDPLFADPSEGDFRLNPSSPCIDAGSDFFAWFGQILVDLDPEDYYGPAPDQGALEFAPDPLAVRGELPIGQSLLVHPNPFNPQTVLAFTVEQEGRVRISIHDPAGRRVALLVDRVFKRSQHRITWDGQGRDGRPVSSGTYLVRMMGVDGVMSRKVTLVR